MSIDEDCSECGPHWSTRELCSLKGISSNKKVVKTEDVTEGQLNGLKAIIFILDP